MALAIEYERPCHRRYHRVTAPFFVIIKGHEYRATDWSLGGVRIDEFEGKIPLVGSFFKVEISLPFQDFRINFETELEIVRLVDEGRGFGAKFTHLGEREREMMTHFIDEIIRGCMAPVKDTIARMDTPLTPVSTRPPSVVPQETKRNKWQKLLLHPYLIPSLYGLAGLLVFGYAAFLAYANIFHLVVESAVVGGDVGMVKARSDGEIIFRGVEVGETVEQGQVIAIIADPSLDAKVAQAMIEVKRKQSELTFLQTELGLDKSRLKAMSALQSGDLRSRRIEVGNLLKQVRHARLKHRRLLGQLRRRRTQQKTVDNAKAYWLRVRTKLAKARADLKLRKQFSRRKKGSKVVLDGNRLVDNGSLNDARLSLLQNEVALAREEHAILLQQKQQRTLRAPYDSRIIDLPKTTNSTVLRGDVLVVFELLGKSAVTAFLTQEEILKIRIGDDASVFIPALDKTVKARIKSINRRARFVNTAAEHFTWRASNERNAQVVLEIETSLEPSVKPLTPGLPAIVMFKDRENSLF